MSEGEGEERRGAFLSTRRSRGAGCTASSATGTMPRRPWRQEEDGAFTKKTLPTFSSVFLYFLLKHSSFRDLIGALKHFIKYENFHVASPYQVEAPQKLVAQAIMFCTTFVHRIVLWYFWSNNI